MGDDESKFRDAVRGLAEAQQVAVEVEEQQSPRDTLLEMTGGGEEDVETLRAENTQLKTELTANRQELAAKDEEMKIKDEEIALLKAQLQKLQPPKEGVPPV